MGGGTTFPNFASWPISSVLGVVSFELPSAVTGVCSTCSSVDPIPLAAGGRSGTTGGGGTGTGGAGGGGGAPALV